MITEIDLNDEQVDKIVDDALKLNYVLVKGNMSYKGGYGNAAETEKMLKAFESVMTYFIGEEEAAAFLKELN